MEPKFAELRVRQLMDKTPILQKAVLAEPDVFSLLLTAASSQDCANRWRRYEELKRAGSCYVGWDARIPALQSPAVYEAFVTALDELLPVESAQAEEEQAS